MLYPKDPNVRTTKTLDGLKIEWRQQASQGYVLLGMAVFLELMYGGMFFLPSKSGHPKHISGLFLLLGMISVVAIPVAYLGLGVILNVSSIEITRTGLRFMPGKLPLAKRATLEARGIKQFFAMRPTSKGPFAIYAMDASDQVRKIAANLPSSFAAHQISKELNDYYGLEELPVHGAEAELVQTRRPPLK